MNTTKLHTSVNLNSSVKAGLMTLLLAVTQQSVASETNFIANDNTIETRLCIAAATDDSSTLKSLIRRTYKRHTREVANNFNCNGVSMARFAYDFNAKNTFEYLNRYSHASNRVKQSVIIKDLAANKTKAMPKTVVVSAGR